MNSTPQTLNFVHSYIFPGLEYVDDATYTCVTFTLDELTLRSTVNFPSASFATLDGYQILYDGTALATYNFPELIFAVDLTGIKNTTGNPSSTTTIYIRLLHTCYHAKITTPDLSGLIDTIYPIFTVT